MKAEIERILGLVRDGKLSTEQASELIEALTGSTRGDTAERSEPEKGAADTTAHGPQARDRGRPHEDVGPERSHDYDDRRRESRRHRHGHRHWHRGPRGFDRMFDDLGDDLERAMGAGARTLRWALKSGLQMKGEGWGEGANSSVLSRAEAPSGRDFECTDNELTVSHLRNLRLERSTFSRNELHASSIQDVELVDARVTGLHLRGSSIKELLLEKGELRDLEFNGAGLVHLTSSDGRVIDCHFNGVQLRDFAIAASTLESSRFNGSKLKTVVVRADSLIKGLSTNGLMGRNWLFENAVVSDTSFSGLRVDGFVMKRAGLERVTFETTDWPRRMDHSTGLIRDLELQRVILKDCRFENCHFDGTRFEGFDAAGLTFEGVDFTGLTVRSAEELARLAGARDVA